MPKKRKPPAIPTAPLAEAPLSQDTLAKAFEGCPTTTGYQSTPFTQIDGFEKYAKGLFQTLRINGRGETIFPDEGQFLAELDSAFLHYGIYRPIVTPEICGTFDEQRRYFKDLHRALQRKKPSTRLAKVQQALDPGTEYDFEVCRERRLARAGLDLGVLKRVRSAVCNPRKQPDPGTMQDLEKLNDAVAIVISELKGQQSGQNAELYLLIEQLGVMYELCSGRKPSVTELNHSNEDRGVFFNLVESVLLKVFNKCVAVGTYKPRDDGTVKPYSIVEGIRFLN